jgi:ankyrin repeat protein
MCRLAVLLLALPVLLGPAAAKRRKRCDFKTVQAQDLASATGFESDRPLLIQGLGAELPADRTRDGLRAALDGLYDEHDLVVGDFGVVRRVAPHSEMVSGGSSFSAWLDDDDEPDDDTALQPYLFHVCSNAPSCDGALVQYAGVPSVVRHLSRHLFIAAGTEAKGLPLHHHEATWGWAVSGTKHWYTAPPGEPPAQPYTHFNEAFLSKGLPQVQRCVQRAGEIVYLPPQWWHTTFAQSDWTLTVGGQGLSPGALYHAARGDVTELAKLLAGRGAAASPSAMIDLACLAAEGGHTGVLQYLAGQGVDLSQTDAEGKSPAFRAVQNGHLHVLVALLALGVPIVTEQPSSLHQACERGNAAVVELLLRQGADAHKPDAATGALAANAAAEFGQLAALRALATHGVDLNTQDRQGKTCAHSAAERGHMSVLRYLLAEQDDLNLVRKTPFWRQFHQDDQFAKTQARDEHSETSADKKEAFSAGPHHRRLLSKSHRGSHRVVFRPLRNGGAAARSRSGGAVQFGGHPRRDSTQRRPAEGSVCCARGVSGPQ